MKETHETKTVTLSGARSAESKGARIADPTGIQDAR